MLIACKTFNLQPCRGCRSNYSCALYHHKIMIQDWKRRNIDMKERTKYILTHPKSYNAAHYIVALSLYSPEDVQYAEKLSVLL